MIYDGLSYSEQIKEIWNSLTDEERKNVNEEEFLSGLRKKDKLYPVITLVFYYGDEWDGSTELYDMFSLSDRIDRRLLEKYVPNYRINLVNPDNIEDCTIFKSDLQLIFGMLQCRKNKKSLIEYMNKNNNYFSAVDSNTAYAISAMLRSEEWMNKLLDEDMKEGNDMDMCKALQDLYDEGVSCGIEQGIDRGKEETIKEMVSIMRDRYSDDEIIDRLKAHFGMTEEQAREYLLKC